MQTLSNLVTRARRSGRWAACRMSGLSTTSARMLRRLVAPAVDPCRLPAPVPIPVRVPRLRRAVLFPVLMLAMVAATPALASHPSRFELTADGRLVDVQVLVSGRAAPLYFPTDGGDRRYVQAFKGRNYALAVTNNTGRRIGVLITVDGLNVVSGRRSGLGPHEAMYVLAPWERTVIRGWRSSLDDIRRFVFVDEERSYAERTGQASGELGWIRVLAFRERGARWFEESPGRIHQLDRDRSRDGLDSFDSRREKPGQAGEDSGRNDAAPEAREPEGDSVARRKAAGPTHSLESPPSAQSVPGTGWGDKRRDPVRRVWFEAERRATDHVVLRYEYASGLRALGIFPRGSRDRLWERERGELGFAQPPRW